MLDVDSLSANAENSDHEAVGQSGAMVSQHVIDPDLCIVCMGCMGACPSSAIEDGGGVLAIDPAKCNDCRDCISECSTGAIETWISVPRGEEYSVEEQFEWSSLPAPAIV